MSKCTFKKLSMMRAPEMPDIREILREIALILREKRYDPSRYKERDDLAYWVLQFLGADTIPVGDCEKKIPIDRLGFYQLSDYDEYNVAKEPAELVMVGKPTPLVKLYIERKRRPPYIWAKLEWYNPFSLSVKDRIAWQMIRLSLENCKLPQYEGMIEVSSSNTGIALAALSAILGVNFKVILPSFAPIENERILRLLGADVERTDAGITTELIDKVKKEAEKHHLYHPDQFNNDANLLAHMRYTARELLIQLQHVGVKPSKLVLLSGTSGTASAVSFVLTNYYHDDPPKTYIVTPAPNEKIEGIRRLETGVKWLDMIGVKYEVIEVTRSEALNGIKQAARVNGIIPGVSGGAAFAAIKKLYDNGELELMDNIVTIIPDTGFKYPKAIEKII
ncbi:MAG: pyridoxal-phosphate dependent enzyme [Desulfurococcales archaeon]|nr:pyridoxal-phosphate dependent enzyme [Desulfurococcales archaeon]